MISSYTTGSHSNGGSWSRTQMVAYLGLTTAGNIGTSVAFTIEEAIIITMAIAAAGREVNPDVIIICHGGPFDEPENVGKALAKMP